MALRGCFGGVKTRLITLNVHHTVRIYRERREVVRHSKAAQSPWAFRRQHAEG